MKKLALYTLLLTIFNTISFSQDFSIQKLEINRFTKPEDPFESLWSSLDGNFITFKDVTVDEIEINFFISTDTTYDVTDDLVGVRFVKKGAGYYGNQLILECGKYNSGYYYVIAFIDPKNKVAETNENNNTISKKVYIQGRSCTPPPTHIDITFPNEISFSSPSSLSVDYELRNISAEKLDIQGIEYYATNGVETHKLNPYRTPYIQLYPNQSYPAYSQFYPSSFIKDGWYIYAEILFQTPNGIGIDVQKSTQAKLIKETTTSINEIGKEKSRVFPNPTTSFIEINNNNETWTITNTHGKVILSGEKSVIDMSSLTNGIYFIRFNNSSQKIIKQ